MSKEELIKIFISKLKKLEVYNIEKKETGCYPCFSSCSAMSLST